MMDKKLKKKIQDNLNNIFLSKEQIEEKLINIFDGNKEKKNDIIDLFNDEAVNASKNIDDLILNSLIEKTRTLLIDQFADTYYSGCIAGVITAFEFNKLYNENKYNMDFDFDLEEDLSLKKKQKVLEDLLDNKDVLIKVNDGKVKYKSSYTRDELYDAVMKYGQNSDIVKKIVKIIKGED